jgi:hypothetical protein
MYTMSAPLDAAHILDYLTRLKRGYQVPSTARRCVSFRLIPHVGSINKEFLQAMFQPLDSDSDSVAALKVA